MKKIILSAFCISSIAFAQTTDMVSLGASYANDSYYSFENGEEVNTSALNWDLAFEMGGMATGVRLNERNATLWVYPGAISDWATLDSTGHSSWTELHNNYEDWSSGAFNDAAATGASYGWGEYTGGPLHNVEASKIFLIQLADNSYRKLKIDLTSTSSVFQVTHDLLDNSNEVITPITIADYAGKSFVYYDIATETVIDREPIKTDWDIVFTNYIFELAPGYFGGTTGALHNKNTATSEVSGVPTATSTPGTFTDEINTIGYDWKTYTGTYTIVDDLTYFVETQEGDIWKLIFTQFEGSSNGNIHFTKEKIATAGIAEYTGADIHVYPNPAIDVINVKTANAISSISIIDLAGKTVKEVKSNNLLSIQISTLDLNNGVYILNTLDDSNRSSSTRIVIQH